MGANCSSESGLGGAAHGAGRDQRIAEDVGQRPEAVFRQPVDLHQDGARQLGGDLGQPDEEQPRPLGIFQRAMLARHAQPKVLGQDAQAVARPARQQDRRQLPGVQPGVLGQQALAAQEAQVEADVVADHRRAADEARDLAGDLVEARLADHVAVGDAGELRDLVGDGPAGIDQRAVAVD